MLRGMICYIDNIVNTIVIKGNHNSQPSTFNSHLKNGGLHVLRCHENKNHIKIENRTHTFSKSKSCSARQGFIAIFYICGAACEIF